MERLNKIGSAASGSPLGSAYICNAGPLELSEVRPFARKRNYQTPKTHASLEDESARAVRLANQYCERIAARVDEVDGRDAHSWLGRAIAYLDFVSGKFPGARPHADLSRRDPVLVAGCEAAVRILNNADHALDVKPIGIVEPVLNPTPRTTDEERELAALNRNRLIELLMEANPEMTERKHLVGFARHKLARLIVEARAKFAKPAPVALKLA